jgi:ketosteroid isomerase-like protein
MDQNGSLPTAQEIIQLVIQFNEMLNAHSVDGMMRFLTEDSVFENTYPPPDGERYIGQASVRAFWEDFFRIDQGQRIEIEEIFSLENRCVMRWVYYWREAGLAGHVRGVDLYTIRGGRISEKLSYVKG